MLYWVRKAAPMLKLTRVTTGFGAVGNLWFVILWSRTTPNEHLPAYLSQEPLWAALTGGLLVGLGLYAFGAALNDLLDLHKDRALGTPGHPIVDGSASLELAICAVAGALMMAILGATFFGTGAILLTLVLAIAILIFNALGKYVPGMGMVLLSVIYAGHMLIPNIWMRFMLPVWLVMTHAMVVVALAQYLGRRSPPISRRAAIFAGVGWGVCSLLLLALAWYRKGTDGLWPNAVPMTALFYPGLCVILFTLFIFRRTKRHGTGAKLGERISRYGAIWPTLYAVAWLFGAGHEFEALLMAGLSAVGFLSMASLREFYGLIDQPVGYRL
tara:strand:- start:1103 stop:2086 length:984 start_codon:yes stop_codon:yes gene_type:complete